MFSEIIAIVREEAERLEMVSIGNTVVAFCESMINSVEDQLV
jgi:hypothetical protein